MSTSVPQPILAGSVLELVPIPSLGVQWHGHKRQAPSSCLSSQTHQPPPTSHQNWGYPKNLLLQVLPFGLKLCVSTNSEPGLTSQSLLTTVPQAWVWSFLSPEPKAKYKLGMMDWILLPVGEVMGVSPEDKLKGAWCSWFQKSSLSIFKGGGRRNAVSLEVRGGLLYKNTDVQGAQVGTRAEMHGWEAPRAGRALAGCVMGRGDLAGPGAPVPAVEGALSHWTQKPRVCSWSGFDSASRCPFLPVLCCQGPSKPHCLPKSGLCPIFSLIELMLLSAPKTHGIALFGSGPDFNRRGKEKRTANKAISFNCKSHRTSCFFWMTSLKDTE